MAGGWCLVMGVVPPFNYGWEWTGQLVVINVCDIFHCYSCSDLPLFSLT